MKAIDLHTHSTYSDGTLTPSELVGRAADFGLAAVALTDHDTIDGISEAVSAGIERNIEVIPGVELSTEYLGKEIHIVGLFINYTDTALKKELERLRDTRDKRNILLCQKFTDSGFDISYEEMLELHPNAVLTRAHFADILMKKGYVKSRNEAFDRYLGDGRPFYIAREKMEPATAIKLIHEAGGTAILAHPVLYHLGRVQMNRLMDYLCENKIDGLEAIYSTYHMGDELEMKHIAASRNLLISGGSDYHGGNKPDIEIGIGRGKLFIPYQLLDKIKERSILNKQVL